MSNPAATTANLNGACAVLNVAGREAGGASRSAHRIEARPAPCEKPQTPSNGPCSSSALLTYSSSSSSCLYLFHPPSCSLLPSHQPLGASAGLASANAAASAICSAVASRSAGESAGWTRMG